MVDQKQSKKLKTVIEGKNYEYCIGYQINEGSQAQVFLARGDPKDESTERQFFAIKKFNKDLMKMNVRRF